MRTEEEYQLSAFYLIGSIVVSMFILLAVSCNPKPAHADEYQDSEIVEAIYLAEGGKRAEYPYGIRSVKCTGEEECRKICFNTVKNNRVRYAEYGQQRYSDFILFLASRYCPLNAGNDKKGLNKNWIKNVIFFLEKGGA